MEFTRGDTHFVKFKRINSSGNDIEIEPKAMYFTVKHNEYDEEFIFQKTIDNFHKDENNFWHFVIKAEDTENLEYGDYFYDLEVITDDYTKTIAKGEITLTKEVTFKGNEV